LQVRALPGANQVIEPIIGRFGDPKSEGSTMASLTGEGHLSSSCKGDVHQPAINVARILAMTPEKNNLDEAAQIAKGNPCLDNGLFVEVRPVDPQVPTPDNTR
jgi:hypothetical protein